MNSQYFQHLTDVSRETLNKFELYVETLKIWQKKINLVSATTINDIWQRHIYDSWQLLPLINKKVSRETFSRQIIADIGSGAGFPGMVLAILGIGDIHLIEQDQKKAAFLREINRLTGANATIYAANVSHETLQADIITCRAFASVIDILTLTKHMRHYKTRYVLLKSQNVEEELRQASISCNFDYNLLPSLTSATGLLVELTNVSTDKDLQKTSRNDD